MPPGVLQARKLISAIGAPLAAPSEPKASKQMIANKVVLFMDLFSLFDI
jgi:hypothetical protein